MPIYFYAALLCFLSTKNKFFRVAYRIGIVVYGSHALYKMFDENGCIDWISKHHAENIADTMKAETP